MAPTGTEDASTPTQRLDIWLFRTRLFKSRALATQIITKGKVRLTQNESTRRIDKPGFKVRIGQNFFFRRGNQFLTVEVTGLPKRRGPAAEAEQHYNVIATESAKL